MPQEGETVVNDEIKGPARFENRQLDDFVLIRSDGTPTYNFVVVVDDSRFCQVSSRAGETQISENRKNQENENSRLVETKRTLCRGPNRRLMLSRRPNERF